MRAERERAIISTNWFMAVLLAGVVMGGLFGYKLGKENGYLAGYRGGRHICVDEKALSDMFRKSAGCYEEYGLRCG